MLGDEDAVGLLGRIGPASIIDVTARQLFEPASENRDGVTEQQNPVFQLVEPFGDGVRCCGPFAADRVAQHRAQAHRHLGDDPACDVQRRFE
ncbi:hypothetical protein [Nocardia sp. NPDC019302]|uniref:hypothetical protein n=1 Tax=Nocardia sp. NPDC019302 TaxID=3154592 RepID=UPI0033DF5969